MNTFNNPPQMILFDYGQTLINEARFDGIRGSEAVLKYAIKNPYQVTGEELQVMVDKMNGTIGRYSPENLESYIIEVHSRPFDRYLYEYFGLEFQVSLEFLETVFWDAAAPGTATDGIEDFLLFCNETKIRTGVISNISYSGKALKNRINSILPDNSFEFIMASSEYVYRKPNPMLFELALRKAQISAENVWYCGDNVFCDVEGAALSGITPVWYTGANKTGSFQYTAALEIPKKFPKCEHLIVEDWEELKTIIKKKKI